MSDSVKILLQSTIPDVENDWHIGRFSLLKAHLESLVDESGRPRYQVTARNLERDESGSDPVLSRLDASEYDQLWLFAVDIGDGLTEADCIAISSFHQMGGGIFSTRDHQDLGSSLCTIGGIGPAHFFNTKNCDPDETRNCRDDELTTSINYPNYHSGSNGDYQKIEPAGEIHELLLRPDKSVIEFFPAHPHEGGIGAPPDQDHARVIATGKSTVTQRPFNLIVAFDYLKNAEGGTKGRGIAESSFHHLVDYNWDTDHGSPDFVEEAPGDGFKKNPEALNDVKTYVANLARWLNRPGS